MAAAYALAALGVSSCAVYKAANQPTQKDLSVVAPGNSRDRVIAELGAPVTSEPTQDGRKEIYTFIQGYSKLNKAGRAFWHGAADVLSLGMWEAIGTPLESAFSGKKISVAVIYDGADTVVKSDTISVTDP